MAIDLNKARMVIKSREVVPVRLNRVQVAQRENIITVIQTQSIEDVRYLLKAVTIQEAENQIRIGNEPSRVIVDHREGKPLSQVRRKTEVYFGDIFNRLMIKAVERAVTASIRYAVSNVLKDTPGLKPDEMAGFRELTQGGSWQWSYTKDKGSPAVRVDPGQIGAIPFNALLVYMPRSRYVALANMLAARLDAGWRGQQLWEYGRSGGRGFMYKAVEKIRRNKLLKNYNITVSFTRKYAVPGELYHPGTGKTQTPKTSVGIVIRSRRRRKGYSRRLLR